MDRRKNTIRIFVISIIAIIIANCINAGRLDYAINNNADIDTIEELLDKPRVINGVNTRPSIIPIYLPIMWETFGDVLDLPLHAACSRGDYLTVKALVENGADVNKLNSTWRLNSPLLTTLIDQEENKDRFKIAKYLIDKGADINYRNTKKQVALTACLKRSCYKENNTEELKKEQMELFVYLLEHCKTTNVPKYEDDLPISSYPSSYSNLLDATIAYDNLDAMLYLVETGYCTNSDIPKLNGSQMSYLAYRAPEDIFKYYYDGANVDQIDDKGRTMLHNAVLGYRDKNCEYLIKKGADITIKDNYGKTAYDYIHDDDMETRELFDNFCK